MVDLSAEYTHLKGEIDAAVARVMARADFIRGEEVELFEQALARYLGVKHVVAVGNGTDALMLALMALGLQPGDEVIVPDFTFVATAEAAAHIGLVPVPVDVDPCYFTIDAAAVERAVTPRTRAIVPVHLFGLNADMDSVLNVARRYNLRVVEDAAQSLGAEYIGSDGRRHKSGTMGDVGCTSFFPTKNLGCYGDGGAVFTNNHELAQAVRQLAAHGSTAGGSYSRVGVNSRLDTIQAAILLAKLPYLDTFIAKRGAAAARYTDCLCADSRFVLPAVPRYSTHTYNQFTVRCEDGASRNTLSATALRSGVQTKIYYPSPIHRHEIYSLPRHADAHFAVSNSLSATCISLPIHPFITDGEIDRVVKNITVR